MRRAAKMSPLRDQPHCTAPAGEGHTAPAGEGHTAPTGEGHTAPAGEGHTQVAPQEVHITSAVRLLHPCEFRLENIQVVGDHPLLPERK